MPVRSNTCAFISGIACIHATMTKTSKRKGGTFSCTFPMDESGGASQFLQGGTASISFTDGSSSASMEGQVDNVCVEWIDREVTVTGRDAAAAKLGESRINKQYKNQQSTEIVQDIGQQAGVQVQASSGSSGDAGKKYNTDTVHMLLNKTPFEALNWLAERDGCRWFVDGGTLYYQPKDQGNSGGMITVTYSPPSGGYETSNTVFLKTTKNMNASRPIQATVKSWHQKDKKLYTGTANGGGSTGQPLNYEMHFPGMTQEQVQQIAKSHVSNYQRHALAIDVEMPGDCSADATGQVTLQGTGSEFDTTYDIDSVTFNYMSGPNGNLSMSICGKTGGSGGGGD